MSEIIHIRAAAQALVVSPHYLRILEWKGRIPPARRDLNGRIYTPFDIALLRSIGVGTHPKKLRSPDMLMQGERDLLPVGGENV